MQFNCVAYKRSLSIYSAAIDRQLYSGNVQVFFVIRSDRRATYCMRNKR